MGMDFKAELNPSQYDAVMYHDGPSLVIAGAGSGKTRVLTYKIAYLLEQGYNPREILALTFTNKAANQMRERVALAVGHTLASGLWMGTFHSVFCRILRQEAELIGFPRQFTIYDAADSKNLIQSIIKEMALDEKTYKPATVQARISNAKNRLITPDVYAHSKETQERDMVSKTPLLKDIYRRYSNRCRKAGAMDFDDLLLFTFFLFRDFPSVLERYQERFKYILVDEYQDTNFAQHSIVLRLMDKYKMVCVVGDDAQSIYSFRGAEIDNILSFTRLYPQTKLFKLEQNYRSTQTIVSAANSLIEKNVFRIRKNVYSKKEIGERIEVFQAYSDIEESDIVAAKITRLKRQYGYRNEDFAVLYRANSQSRVFEEAFRKRGMPYRIYGGLSFYQRKEIKNVIAYFRLVVNPHDEEAFKRVLNYPVRGIGATTLGKIVAYAGQNEVSLWQAMCGGQVMVGKAVQAKLNAFKELMESFITNNATMRADELGTDIIRRSGIWAHVLEDTSAEGENRKKNIEELINGMVDFCSLRTQEGNTKVTLTDFLSEVALLTDQDTDTSDNQDKILLMTAHAAKGLEFKNVFIVDMDDSVFPNKMVGDSTKALEEERRLFYVAITRAQERCFLSFTRTRFHQGKLEFGRPSRFLRDIDPRYLHLDSGAEIFPSSVKKERESLIQGTFKPVIPVQKVKKSWKSLEHVTGPTVPNTAIMVKLSVGQQVTHERFGKGTVLSVEGIGENAKAAIRFEHAGVKQLLLRFARLQTID